MVEEGPPDVTKRQTLRRVAAFGAVTPLLSMGSASASNETGDSERRQTIAQYIFATPGVHFSKIRDDLSLGTGETQYHLKRLEQESIVESVKDGDFRRYFAAQTFDAFDKRALGFLRRSTPQAILLHLLRAPDDSPSEIATALSVSPAAISQSARHLEEGEIIDRNQGSYTIEEPERLIVLLVRYSESFGPAVHEFVEDVPSYISWTAS